MNDLDDAERVVLLELVVDAPIEGDTTAELAARLQLPPVAIDRAAEALAGSGLAVRDGDVVRASTAALRFDALWPVAL